LSRAEVKVAGEPVSKIGPDRVFQSRKADGQAMSNILGRSKSEVL
jgi:hypothetical protein